ncbi:hypothetical protein A1Q1_04677 [Trichosporon asahii var. asahii CBS 2479]|uniref:Sodium/calcium exchanger membrane region domain-containing protein n=1 Tax=Trichosporon asahii var. asahii (strain ATCC 90039 / CBS 2479 / JCM 2466 / KCTC 7840 / NBRC 103889/ NCYC 2677 / UAMH 7654) TaxID=1186058 RepID=J6EV89_TRIAS|nr:hypothetical protein A1Q1_04677 [Trichosporon asahii var. asahii CBS 2479]EJT46712.1 hypothetical protein A1Q1_04677 [Trichosporon asahii var. asahii CBS 2479]
MASPPPPARGRRPQRPGRLLAAVAVGATLLLTVSLSRSHDERVARLAKRFVEDTMDEKDVGTLFGIDYDELYAQTPPALRPVFVVFLCLILLLLFCSISITASDFFCPNLATIAAYLGLSETTAGVTLLAFGNGSPDVFSTFASVKSGTFGLAIGELIGAASFITSIVVGSIALVQPFQVPRHAFVRDSLFFICAVILLMVVLADGKLTLRESGSMVLLYVVYVAVVVMGNWYLSRKRREMDYAELGWKRPDEEEQVENIDADPQLVPQQVPPSAMSSRRGSASRRDDGDDVEDTPARANFSLLGAVEFRDVVNSLRREMNTPTGSPLSSRPNSPISPWEGEEPSYFHHHHHHRHRRTSGSHALEQTLVRRVSGRNRSGSLHPNWTSRRAGSGDEIAASAPAPALLDPVPGSPSQPESLPLSSLQPSGPTKRPSNLSRTSLPALKIPARSPALPAVDITSPSEPSDGAANSGVTSGDPSTGPSPRLDGGAQSPIPRLDLVTPEGETEPIPLTRSTTFGSIVEAGRAANDWMRAVLCILFPSLQHFREKSLLGKGLAMLSTPAIFMLTITLPVVDDGRMDEGGIALPDEDEPLPRHDEEEEEELEHLYEHGVAVSLAHVRHHSQAPSECPSECDSECSEPSLVQFTPALAAAQCICGPLVCAYLVFQEEPYLPWVLLGCGLAGGVCAVITYTCSTDGHTQPWRLVRCVAGFACSTVWIASIADEVVAVLRTFGEIFGLSDAIIGLTIFAVGNSLADLVANVTIAQFAPNMAYAACFGGPMLNLLLGVGGSGSYWILRSREHSPVRIHFSPTLWVSGVGLIAILVTTAVVVPLNKYRIDKKWAAVLLVAYASLMTLNVIVEIKTGK